MPLTATETKTNVFGAADLIVKPTPVKGWATLNMSMSD